VFLNIYINLIQSDKSDCLLITPHPAQKIQYDHFRILAILLSLQIAGLDFHLYWISFFYEAKENF